jgi:choline kinase
MRAIIVAAGRGHRLGPATAKKPKCLIEIAGKTILERELEALRANGIHDVVLVRGYMGSTIKYPDIRYRENTEFKDNNILASLFAAEDCMDEDFIFSYSDILYGPSVVAKLLESRGDIALVVDVGWKRRYEGDAMQRFAKSEFVKVREGLVTEIGMNTIRPDEAYGEFIGLAKFKKPAAEEMRRAYKAAGRSTPFHHAPDTKKAYLTDMIEELIGRGWAVSSVDIQGGWLEIDTREDLEIAKRTIAGKR